MNVLEVRLWDERVGALAWDAARGVAQFQYDADFLRSGLQLSPLRLSSTRKVQQFPELARSALFLGLPGFIAESLPGRFGNQVLQAWLSSQGRQLQTMNPLERLALIGSRGSGALEYLPDTQAQHRNVAIPLNVASLINTAQKIALEQQGIATAEIEMLLTACLSSDGAKAVIGWNPQSAQIISGQALLPAGFEHWFLKFDSTTSADNSGRGQPGRIEYAYSEMAHAAGINVMESRLLQERKQESKQAWVMTRRFDRVDGNSKVHSVSFAGLVHADRDPPGAYGYEHLFQAIRELRLGQEALNEMFRRMVFNICARNQRDHTASHMFVMFGDGEWQLAPACDLSFTFPSVNRLLSQQQMTCNGKRDNFTLDDLLQAASAADVKRPLQHIERVQEAIDRWPEFAAKAGLGEKLTMEIGLQHLLFVERKPVEVIAEAKQSPAQGSLF